MSTKNDLRLEENASQLSNLVLKVKVSSPDVTLKFWKMRDVPGTMFALGDQRQVIHWVMSP